MAVLIAAVLVLGACTAPSVTVASDAATAASEAASPAAADAATPSGAPTASEAATSSEVASDAPTDDPVDDRDGSGGQTPPADDATQDDATKTERRTANGLVAVAPGDRGAKVEKLQRRLAKLGFAPGPVDGAYGTRTEAAVRAFQMLAGLERTGRANAKTVAAIADYESDVTVLQAGDKGRAVRKLQRRLARGPFDPGPADGSYGTKTVEAVWALEKLAGVPVDGNWGPLDEHALERLADGKVGGAKRNHKKRWVEFDLSQQVMKVYDPGTSGPVLVSHGSSGSGVPWENEEHSGSAVTPPGDFVISRRIAGWRESSLDIGRMYNPLYFNGGIAFHGATSVPLYPASHGCVRLPMHIAEYLPDELPDGTPVHVLQ